MYEIWKHLLKQSLRTIWCFHEYSRVVDNNTKPTDNKIQTSSNGRSYSIDFSKWQLLIHLLLANLMYKLLKGVAWKGIYKPSSPSEFLLVFTNSWSLNSVRWAFRVIWLLTRKRSRHTVYKLFNGNPARKWTRHLLYSCKGIPFPKHIWDFNLKSVFQFFSKAGFEFHARNSLFFSLHLILLNRY